MGSKNEDERELQKLSRLKRHDVLKAARAVAGAIAPSCIPGAEPDLVSVPSRRLSRLQWPTRAWRAP